MPRLYRQSHVTSCQTPPDIRRGGQNKVKFQIQKFLCRKQICTEHQNILTAIHEQD